MTSLLTKEVKERIERRFEWAVENEMRANSQYAQYKQDITTLMAEIYRLNDALDEQDDIYTPGRNAE
mgnify:CR=1 FL=1